ncbi:MAG: hypothetical protein EZS28_001338 [Streblomastix strix]|uniref:Uncharacterized protein n=1 Tax=Streblomastix strix TaxID=222440 RepID=A0A5J4X8E5_9EUKA|nr:MAG: hypothetical protein EZS28_001338 [Streblomastix strix]
MIPAEKPDTITLLNDAAAPVSEQFSVRLINCKDLDDAAIDPKNKIAQTPLVHFLCDTIVRIMFNDAPEPQVLNFEIIGEIGGSLIMAG